MGPKVPAERLRQSLYTVNLKRQSCGRRGQAPECKTIVLNRFGSADLNRIPFAPSSRGFFVLRDGT